MLKLTHGSLYTGIGGFDIAAKWAGIENIFQCEKDEYCKKLLIQNFPEINNRHYDVKKTDFTKYRGAIDILTGGVPCQPTSLAGKRKGKKDDRWLWPDTIRVLDETKPKYGIFENPASILSLDNGETFEGICREMEDQGYEITPILLRACFIGAWHQRARIFIVADSKIKRNGRLSIQQWRQNQAENFNSNGINEITSDINSERLQIWDERTEIKRTNESPQGSKSIRRNAETNWRQWETEPGMVRMVHGVPKRMDRIKGLGNAVIPQLAYIIFEAIKQVNSN